MIYSILSHFDNRLGPRAKIILPDPTSCIQLDHVSFLIDFYEQGFFMHTFGELKSANLIFKVSNPYARGKEEVLMISLVIIDEDYDLTIFEEILSVFAEGFKELPDIYQGFYIEQEKLANAEEKFQKIQSYLRSFHNSLPKERASFKIRKTRILIFGLPDSGISAVIKSLEQTFFNKDYLSGEISVSKNMLGDLSFITYNLYNQSFIQKASSVYFKEIYGIVFVLDSSDTSKLKEAQELLHQLTYYPETYRLPLLILLNKTDLTSSNTDDIVRILDIPSLKNKNIKYFKTSALNNDGIMESFNWLAVEITNSLIRDPKNIFI